MLPPILILSLSTSVGVTGTVWLGAGMLLAPTLTALIAKD
jgi:hypothetical protein